MSRIKKTQISWEISIATAYKKMLVNKKADNKNGFYEVLDTVIPQVKAYTKSRLIEALKKGQIPEGKYDVNEFISELYIDAYDNIETLSSEEDWVVWLIQKIEAHLDDIFVEEEFDNFFFSNVDKITDLEKKAMEEKYIIDADGDYVMYEDLDDQNIHINDYELNKIYIENFEEDWIKKVSNDLEREKIDRKIAMVVNQMPKQSHSVFNLYYKLNLSEKIIARIKNISEEKVRQILGEAKGLVKSYFLGE